MFRPLARCFGRGRRRMASLPWDRRRERRGSAKDRSSRQEWFPLPEACTRRRRGRNFRAIRARARWCMGCGLSHACRDALALSEKSADGWMPGRLRRSHNGAGGERQGYDEWSFEAETSLGTSSQVQRPLLRCKRRVWLPPSALARRDLARADAIGRRGNAGGGVISSAPSFAGAAVSE